MPSLLDFSQFERQLAQVDAPLPFIFDKVHLLGNMRLVYSLFKPVEPVQDLLVFYHGGGAHMGAGYQFLASALVRRAPVAVCLVDLRGHGLSSGPRGHTETKEEVWRDVERVVTSLHTKMPNVRIHLGGHSSGAGMLLNYRTMFAHNLSISSLVFLAPEFGPYAPVRRVDEQGKTAAFSRPRRWAFVINGITRGRFCGDMPAIDLSYGELDEKKRDEFVSHYTVNMALAITPLKPAEQLARLDVRTTIIAARCDELFCPEKMEVFVKTHGAPCVHYEILEEATHLDIMLHSCDRVVSAMGMSVNATSPMEAL